MFPVGEMLQARGDEGAHVAALLVSIDALVKRGKEEEEEEEETWPKSRLLFV